MPSASAQKVIDQLRLRPEIERLRTLIKQWVASADINLREMLEHQFHAADAKYFRPLTVFSCHRAVSDQPVPETLVTSAQVVEMFHNVSLIIDDIVDGSQQRRGKDTLQYRYGQLHAYMVSGYIVADAYDILARQVVDEVCDMHGCRSRFDQGALDDRAEQGGAAVDTPLRSKIDATGLIARATRESLERAGPVRYDMRLLSELMKRLAVAESVQWENRKSRRLPLGLADWYYLAREDTGSMFEVCAALGARSQRLRRFGRLLGMLYHGCDDVADVRNAKDLGGGGAEDLEEGILTLPAALAIQNDSIRALFCKPTRSEQDKRTLLSAYQDQLETAERELDNIKSQAQAEARFSSQSPDALMPLIEYVRPLSGK